MKRRTGNHRLNASHSAASKAKPQIERLRRQIRKAITDNDLDTANRLQKELEWTQINSSGAF